MELRTNSEMLVSTQYSASTVQDADVMSFMSPAMSHWIVAIKLCSQKPDLGL